MLGPWVLSSLLLSERLNHGRHDGWAMDALFPRTDLTMGGMLSSQNQNGFYHARHHGWAMNAASWLFHGCSFLRTDSVSDSNMDVMMLGPWMLFSLNRLAHEHHGWAMDALFEHKTVRPMTMFSVLQHREYRQAREP